MINKLKHYRKTVIKQHSRLIGTLVVVLLIVTLATALRFINLTKIPVFADEAIYIRWAQVMRAESTLRFLPLSDGKQPLFMWLTIPALKLFTNPLVAGRAVSVFAGALTSIGIFVLAYLLTRSKKVSLLAMFFYLVSPFAFFFHRMALVDSLLSMFGIWTAVGGLLMAKFLRLDTALLTGFALGGAWLTKSPALFFAMLLPTSGLFLKRYSLRSIFIFSCLVLVTIALGYGFYNILRLGPNYHMMASRNLDYVLPFSHILTNPRDPFIFHADRAIEWIVILGPWPILLLALLSTFAFLKKDFKNIIFLIGLFAFPLLVEAMYAKVFTARYIFFVLPPLFVLAAFWINSKNRVVLLIGGFLSIVFILLGLQNTQYLLFDPEKAYLPQSERSGYLSEWTAGQGLEEISVFIRKEHEKTPDIKITVGTEGYFGTLPDGLQIFLEKVPNVTVFGTGLNFTDVPQSLKDAKNAGDKTYFVVNASRLNLKNDASEYGLKTIASYQKALRASDSHEYVVHGPYETLYFFEVK